MEMKTNEHSYLECYLDWVSSQVLSRYEKNKYSKLLHFLSETPFCYVIQGDRNRVKDAIFMRRTWADENNVIFDVPDNEIYNGSCSVLEMLVSFAKRIDKEWTGVESDDHPEQIFAIFMTNLELDVYSDDRYNPNIVEDIVYKWMYGKIKRNGEGGLFPLYDKKSRHIDQRNKEMWLQMMPWINENFVW